MTVSILLRLGLATVVALGGASACMTGDKKAENEPPPPPPPITATMPLADALSAAIDYGGETMQEVKRLVKKRKEGEQAGKMLESSLRKAEGSYEAHQFLNAGHLYAFSPVPLSLDVFHDLIGSSRPLSRQLGWQLAASKPSPTIARAVDQELTRLIGENELDQMLMPQMANAVRANQLKGSYTILRQGLMTKGDEEYALAMIALDPERASEDFMAYLALAPAEELRQLTMSSVSLFTCIAILKHMQQVPPPMASPYFDHLFVYAVSRNTGLAELAQTVIEAYVPARTDTMAQFLAKHPVWVQIAYLGNARRRMNPKLGLLLEELKKVSAEHDVVAEIDEIKF